MIPPNLNFFAVAIPFKIEPFKFAFKSVSAKSISLLEISAKFKLPLTCGFVTSPTIAASPFTVIFELFNPPNRE